MPTASIGDLKLYYEECGDGAPLLFIHGLGSSTRDWERQVPVFSGRYRVVTLDLRGHGRSDKPPGPYIISLFAQEVADLMKSLDLGPAHVVGLSLGGFVAAQLAVDHGELLRSVVIVNTLAIRGSIPAMNWWWAHTKKLSTPVATAVYRTIL